MNTNKNTAQNSQNNFTWVLRVDAMRQLAEDHSNFQYTPCISGDCVPEGFSHGRTNEVVMNSLSDLTGWRVLLCGHPEMIEQIKEKKINSLYSILSFLRSFTLI